MAFKKSSVIIGGALGIIIATAVLYISWSAMKPKPDTKYHTITITLDNAVDPPRIIIYPVERPVKPGDVVVFSNKTERVVEVDFTSSEPPVSPFDSDHELFTIHEEGSNEGHEEGAEVTFDVPDGDDPVVFYYDVTTDGLSAIWDDGTDQSSQSPRIRVGPKD
jgi:hypothetical protein